MKSVALQKQHFGSVAAWAAWVGCGLGSLGTPRKKPSPLLLLWQNATPKAKSCGMIVLRTVRLRLEGIV